MATKTTVALEDDLDGGPAEVTLRFGLGGAEYEIDLNAANATAFRCRLAPFVSPTALNNHGRAQGPAVWGVPAGRRPWRGSIRAEE